MLEDDALTEPEDNDVDMDGHGNQFVNGSDDEGDHGYHNTPWDRRNNIAQPALVAASGRLHAHPINNTEVLSVTRPSNRKASFRPVHIFSTCTSVMNGIYFTLAFSFSFIFNRSIDPLDRSVVVQFIFSFYRHSAPAYDYRASTWDFTRMTPLKIITFDVPIYVSSANPVLPHHNIGFFYAMNQMFFNDAFCPLNVFRFNYYFNMMFDTVASRVRTNDPDIDVIFANALSHEEEVRKKAFNYFFTILEHISNHTQDHAGHISCAFVRFYCESSLAGFRDFTDFGIEDIKVIWPAEVIEYTPAPIFFNFHWWMVNVNFLNAQELNLLTDLYNRSVRDNFVHCAVAVHDFALF